MLLDSVVGPERLTGHLLFIFYPFDLEEERNGDFGIYLETYHWLLQLLSSPQRKKKEKSKAVIESKISVVRSEISELI